MAGPKNTVRLKVFIFSRHTPLVQAEQKELPALLRQIEGSIQDPQPAGELAIETGPDPASPSSSNWDSTSSGLLPASLRLLAILGRFRQNLGRWLRLKS